jgi:hypothetical protein
MRFLIFNAIVGLALVYLFNGGQLPTGGLLKSFVSKQESAEKTAGKTIEHLNEKLAVIETKEPSPIANKKSEQKIEPKSYARDVIPTTKPATVINNQARAPLPLAPITKSDEQLVQPLQLPKAQIVKSLPVHTIDEAKAVNLSDQQRHDEVPNNRTSPTVSAKFSLKKGTSLMSTTERRRQLDNLAEEMELLYLEKNGG